MKQYFLKTAGMAVLALTLHASGFAQQDTLKETNEKTEIFGDHDEIIIKKKGEKDSKITVEIKDGKVWINGKPVDEYEDDNVSVHKRIYRSGDGDAFALIAPGEAKSPFRGNFSFNGDGEEFMTNTLKTAFLGVTSEKLDEGGVEITEITKASAAEKAGLKKGDVITKINENQVSSPEGLSKIIHKYKPEDKVTVTYKRDGKEQKAAVVLGKYKMSYSYNYNYTMPKMQELEKMKAFSELDRMEAPRAYSYSYNTGRPKIGIKAQDTEDGKGVKVLDVDDESPADKAGIKEGDVITDFDGKPVNSAQGLAELSRAAKDKNSFKVKFKRDDKAQEVEEKIPKKLKTANL
jgi:serine protease Do